MTDFLEGSKFYQFPSFEVAIYSLLLAMVLSTAIALTYRATFKGTVFPNSLFQSMILSSLVTSMIIMAVGNNIAVGFGIIGVVAVVRFRLQFLNPRNIIFLFAALSVGIATSVYGYSIALAGTLLFCGTAFLLNWSKFQERKSGIWNISFNLPADQEGEDLMKITAAYCDFCHLISLRKREGVDRYEFLVQLKSGHDLKSVISLLSEKVSDLRCDEKGGVEV